MFTIFIVKRLYFLGVNHGFCPRNTHFYFYFILIYNCF